MSTHQFPEIEAQLRSMEKNLVEPLTELQDEVFALKQRGATHFDDDGPGSQREWKDLDRALRTGKLESKAWQAGAVDGSNAVPEVIHNEMYVQLVQRSPIRQEANVVRASSGDFKVVVADDAQAGGWSSETGTRNATANAYLNSVTIPIAEQYALVQMYNHFREDAQFDMAKFVVNEAYRQFAAGEASAFVSGTGSNQPKGFAYAATSAIVDGSGVSPERGFGVFQHIASGYAATLGGDMLSSPQGDIVATLSNTVAALRTGYLPNAKWFMNPGTKATLIQMRDLDGRPIIESGLMGNPDKILGYPIVVAEHMPAIDTNALPIAFGDMRSAYTVADHTAGLRVIVDEVTTKGMVSYYIYRRVGGAPTDTNALKFVKCATS